MVKVIDQSRGTCVKGLALKLEHAPPVAPRLKELWPRYRGNAWLNVQTVHGCCTKCSLTFPIGVAPPGDGRSVCSIEIVVYFGVNTCLLFCGKNIKHVDAQEDNKCRLIAPVIAPLTKVVEWPHCCDCKLAILVGSINESASGFSDRSGGRWSTKN